MVTCSQLYFRSSRASVWGCDPEGASGLFVPPLPRCPQLAWLARSPPEPSDWHQSFGSSRPRIERSSPQAPPWSVFTVLQSVVLTAFLWTIWNHAGWRICPSDHSAPLCLCINMRVCATSDSWWQCAISVCITTRLWYVRIIFFQISVEHLGKVPLLLLWTCENTHPVVSGFSGWGRSAQVWALTASPWH